MATELPRFEVWQSLGGYVVGVIWPDGRTEIAWGGHQTHEAAAEWVRHRARRWLEQRNNRSQPGLGTIGLRGLCFLSRKSDKPWPPRCFPLFARRLLFALRSRLSAYSAAVPAS